MNEKADAVAREFLKEHMPRHKPVHIAILRIAIDACVYCALEKDFFDKLEVHKLYRRAADRVLKLAEPHMDEMILKVQGWGPYANVD